MKKKVIYKGVATAVITPFKNGEIDYGALGNILEYQISAGIDALVIAGTTGEAATLTKKERLELFGFSTGVIKGRVPVIFGCGTNCTSSSIEYVKAAESMGASGALIVTPYYNKGTKTGLEEHYKAIANSTNLPIILYNVPSRTGVDLPFSVIDELIKIDNIVAIKEASDSTDRLTELSARKEHITLYSGNDTQTYTTLALGGSGIISVVSNVFPKEVLKITQSFTRGDTTDALNAQYELLPICRAMFIETNPAPIKSAMSLLGFCADEMRLPMAPPCESSQAIIKNFIK